MQLLERSSIRIDNQLNMIYIIVIQLIVLFFLEFNCLCHDISFLFGLKVFLYQLFAWFLMGLSIVLCLKLSCKNISEVIALSYGLGVVVSIAVYLIFMTFDLKRFLPVFSIIQGILLLIIIGIRKSNISAYECDKHSMNICIFFLVIFFFLSTVAVSFVNSMPNETKGTAYYADWLFWAGNNISFTKSFPAQHFRQVGTILKYHLASSAIMAQVSLCTLVDINYITFYFSSILSNLVLVYSAYFFSSKLLQRKESIVFFFVTVLFTDGWCLTFAWHILLCPFGFDWGYAYCMLSLGVLAKIMQQDVQQEEWTVYYVISCFFLAITTWCKGPIGSVCVIVFIIQAFYLFFKKNFFKGVLGIIGWVGAFIGVYFGLLKNNGSGPVDNRLKYIGALNLNTITEKSYWISHIYKELVEQSKSIRGSFLGKVYSIWLFLFRSNAVLAILLVVSVIYILRSVVKIRHLNSYIFGLTIASICGFFLTIIFLHPGTSQMYFAMATYPMIAACGIWSFEDKFIRNKSFSNSRYISFWIAVALCTLGISLGLYSYWVAPKFREGLAVINHRYTHDDYKYNIYSTIYTDDVDYEMYKWIKDNTEEDSVIIVNNFGNVYQDYTPMAAGVFSERYIWNELEYNDIAEAERRTKFVEQLWMNFQKWNELKYKDIAEAEERNIILEQLSIDFQKSIESLKNENVDYLLVSNSGVWMDWLASKKELRLVFQNEHHILYKIE